MTMVSLVLVLVLFWEWGAVGRKEGRRSEGKRESLHLIWSVRWWLKGRGKTERESERTRGFESVRETKGFSLLIFTFPIRMRLSGDCSMITSGE